MNTFKGGHPHQGVEKPGKGTPIDKLNAHASSATKGGTQAKGSIGRHKSTSGDKAVPGSLGFDKQAGHSHLGHFGKDEVLRKGHNVSAVYFDKNPKGNVYNRGNATAGATVPRRRINRMAKAGVSAGAVFSAGRPIRAAKIQRRENVLAAKASGDKAAVKQARRAGRADVRAARQMVRNNRKAGLDRIGQPKA